MRINHNIAALNTHRQLTANTTSTSKSLEKLSSGLRVNRAGDDAAGLAISEKMRSQIRGLDQASRNANDGISFIGTAEGALNETHSILQRMRELAVQSATDTNDTTDRAEIQKEINELLKEVDRISTDTEFNGMKMLDGSFSAAGTAMVFHIGSNAGQTASLEIAKMDQNTLGKVGGTGTALSSVGSGGATTNLTTRAGANAAIKVIDAAIKDVSSERAKLGAMQNRLEHTINNLGTTSENLSASESRIRDVDMAKEMMEFTKNNILSQASQAMLAQANMQPQSVLQLLQ
jgi:flagellin